MSGVSMSDASRDLSLHCVELRIAQESGCQSFCLGRWGVTHQDGDTVLQTDGESKQVAVSTLASIWMCPWAICRVVSGTFGNVSQELSRGG